MPKIRANLSTISVLYPSGPVVPPDVYPCSVEDDAAATLLAAVRFPISVASVSEEKGNLSIALTLAGGPWLPPAA